MRKFYVLVSVITLLLCPLLAGNAFAARAMTISGTFPYGTVNKTYRSTNDVGCNYSSYSRLELVSGTLPPGLRFDGKIVAGSVRLIGTPTEEGSYTFTIKLTNVDFPEATATANFTINISYDEKYDTEARSEISGEFRNGHVGLYYHSATEVTFNWSGCKWELESGVLPPGLHLSLLGFQGYDSEYTFDIIPTDHNAELKGTPTTAGVYTFTLRATRRDDERFTATKTFTMTIEELGEPDLQKLTAHSLPVAL